MNKLMIILVAVGLAMDAFAVSVSCGLSIKKQIFKNALYAGISFGIFQAGMTFLGWFAGLTFRNYIEPIDHWVAFLLLAFIGGKMILESRKEDSEPIILTGFKMLITLSIATSIDALAAGISYSTLKIDILAPIIYIGIITLAFSFSGVYIGSAVGKSKKLKSRVDVLGGVILIGIGTKILLEHLL